jgi:hypothetical protein
VKTITVHFDNDFFDTFAFGVALEGAASLAEGKTSVMTYVGMTLAAAIVDGEQEVTLTGDPQKDCEQFGDC